MDDAGEWQLMNKVARKGGQTTMIFDVSQQYPCAYVHWHKMHVQPDGFTAEENFELKIMINQVEKLVVRNTPYV